VLNFRKERYSFQAGLAKKISKAKGFFFINNFSTFSAKTACCRTLPAWCYEKELAKKAPPVRGFY
jgi:hypothetical protein